MNGSATRMHPGDMLLEPLSSTLVIIHDDDSAALALWVEPEHSAEIVHATSIGRGDIIVRVHA